MLPDGLTLILGPVSPECWSGTGYMRITWHLIKIPPGKGAQLQGIKYLLFSLSFCIRICPFGH